MTTLLIGLFGYQLGRRGYGWLSVLMLCFWALPFTAMGLVFQPSPGMNFFRNFDTVFTGSLVVAIITAPGAVLSYMIGRWLRSAFGGGEKFSFFPKS